MTANKKKLHVVKDKKTGEEYIDFLTMDAELMAAVVQRCIGPGRTIEKFSRDTGIAAVTIARLLQKKKTWRPDIAVIHALADSAKPDSGITFEGIAAACGLLSVKSAVKLLKAQYPSLTDVPDYRRREYRDAEVSKYPIPDTDDFERYIDNFSAFVAHSGCNEDVLTFADDLFRNKMFVLALEKWRCHTRAESARKQNECEAFLNRQGDAPSDFPRDLGEKYLKVIYSTLEDMGYVLA